MPERNPFEETMRAERAGMNIPQRTTRPTQGPAGMGFAPPASTGPTRPPGQPMYGRHMGYGGMDSGIFGGQRASGANDMVNAMMGGMDTSRDARFEEDLAKFAPDDWRNIWRLQQRGIDPTPHIESTKWGGPWGGPQGPGWPPRPGVPFPDPSDPFPFPNPSEPPWGGPFDVAERSSDFGSDWRGQQMLFDRIIKANPGIGEDELMILFQQAMDQATA